MKISFLSLTSLLSSILLTAQVGIDTHTPNATLDITASPGDTTKIDGFIIPKLTLSQLNSKTAYSDDQIGIMLYITDISDRSIITDNSLKYIISPGYYFFNNDRIWEPFESKAGTIILRASNSNTQSISSNTYSKIVLQGPSNDGNWIGSENKYIIPITGKYSINVNINLADNTPKRNIYVVVTNSATGNEVYGSWTVNTGNIFTIPYSRLDNFSKNDELSLYVYSKNEDLSIKNVDLTVVLLSIDPE